ncbi:MAG: ABC-type transporter, periplasmic subunit [Firmicutes bacterium]|nr:ABC-type transporter, periplasmic subunit [Bacillota bacterium]
MAAVTALAGVALAACSGASGGAPGDAAAVGNPGKPVTIAMWSPWDTMQPYNTGGVYDSVVYEQILDRLVYLDSKSEFKPRLASKWEVSEDHKTFTFHLNEKAKWTDGQPLTADDVLFTAQIVTNPETQAKSRSMFRYLTGTDDSGVAKDPNALGVKAVDAHTVQFSTKNPMDETSFLYSFALAFYTFPKHVLGGVAPAELHKNDYWHKMTPGSGPYKWVSSVDGQMVELEANPDYFLGAPSIPKLAVRVIPQANLTAGLMSGDIDVLVGFGMGEVPLEDWPTIQQQPNLTAISTPTWIFQVMNVNTAQPYLKDPRIRQAISMAVDRNVMVDQLLKGEGVAARGPFPPSHPYFNKNLPAVPHDLEKAKQLLKDAGWDPNRELVMVTPSGNQVRERSATLMQQDLQKVGVKVKIQLVDYPTSQTMQKKGEYDLGLVGQTGSLDPDAVSPYLMPGSPSNYTKLADQRIGDLLTKGRSEFVQEKRQPFYDQLQTALQDQVPVVYLYHPNSLLAINKRMKDVPVGDFMWYNYGTWMWKVSN